MPVGQEKRLTKQETADVIAYLIPLSVTSKHSP